MFVSSISYIKQSFGEQDETIYILVEVRVSREIKVQRRDKSRRSPLLHRFGAPLAHLATCTEYTGCHEERGSRFIVRDLSSRFTMTKAYSRCDLCYSILRSFDATLSISSTSSLLHHSLIPDVSMIQACRFVLNAVSAEFSPRTYTWH